VIEANYIIRDFIIGAFAIITEECSRRVIVCIVYRTSHVVETKNTYELGQDN
jgi:hypothetical protein